MLKESVTFVCVLKSGKEYNQDHVKRLMDMVNSHYSFPYKFLVLSDLEVACCENVRLQHNWKGWWSKLELFLHDFGKTIYFDLDIDIVKSIDWMSDIDPDDSIHGYRCPIYPKLLNSSVMIWKNAKHNILEGYSPKVNKFWKVWPHRYGDQSWIQRKMFNRLQFLPSEHIERYGREKSKDSASIVVYGGKIRPWSK
jgi:hypothetical protein